MKITRKPCQLRRSVLVIHALLATAIGSAVGALLAYLFNREVYQ